MIEFNLKQKIVLTLIIFQLNHSYSQIIGGLVGSEILIWHETNGSIYKTLTGHALWVNTLKLIKDDFLASGADDNFIKLWNLTTFEFVADLQWHTNYVATLDTFQVNDGTILLASGGADHALTIWNPWTYSLVTYIENAHDGVVECVRSLGPRSGYLVSGGEDAMINIWETNTFKFVRRLEGHGGVVSTLDVLSNGYLASGSYDTTVKIWDLNTAKIVSYFVPPSYSGVHSVKQLKNGALVVVQSFGTIYFYNLTTSQMTALEIEAGANRLFGGLLFNNDEILTIAVHRRAVTINATSYEIIRDYSAPDSDVFCLEYFPSSTNITKVVTIKPLTTTQFKTVVVGGLGSGWIQFWDILSGQTLLTLCGHMAEVTSLKVINDRALASGSSDGSIIVWDLTLAFINFTLNNHTGLVNGLEYLSTGFLVSVSFDQSMIVWNLNTRMMVSKTTIANWFTSVKQISSQYFAASGANRIYIYEVATYQHVGTLDGHSGEISSLEILSSGLLVSSSLDRNVIVWNIATGTIVQQFNPYGSDVYRTRQLPDGSLLVCGNSNSLSKYDLNIGGVAQETYSWINFLPEWYCFDSRVANNTIIVAESYRVKLINVTTGVFSLLLSPVEYQNVLSLEVIDYISLPSTQLNAPCTPVPPTTTTTTTTTSSTTTYSTTQPSTTQISPTTTTSIDFKGFFKMIPNSDLVYLANNMLSSVIISSYLRCGHMCNMDTSCQVFVFADSTKNCSLYRQLSPNFISPVDSTVYFKN